MTSLCILCHTVVPQDLSTGTGCSYPQRAMWTDRGGNVCICVLKSVSFSITDKQSMLNIPEAQPMCMFECQWL